MPQASSPDGIARMRGLIWLVAAAFFMQTLDSTIVNTAVPSIAHALSVPPISLKTALTSYVLTLAICIPASAWLSDRFGTRRVFAASVLIFTLGSLACGISQSLPQLVAARVLQGIGGALLMPIGRYVLVRAFGPKDFVAAMSTAGIPGLLGPVLGPLLGGVLSQYASWRWIFLVNVPVGIVGLWLNRTHMPDFRGERRPFDWIGFALFAVASGLLLIAAETAGDGDYRNAAIAGAIGVFAAFAYWRYGRRARHPVVDLTLFKVRSFTIAVAGGMCTRLGTAGLSFILMLFLQIGCGWSPTMAGLMIVPQAVAMVLMKFLIDRILKRHGYRHTLFVNTALATFLLACFALFGATTPWWAIALLMFAYGFVMSLQYTAMNTLAFVDLGPDRAAQASSVTSAVQYLVISFGIALSSWLLAIFLQGHHHDPAAYVRGFRAAVLVMAAVSLVAVYVFTRLRHDRPLRRPVTTPETAA
ncbi:MAG: DHA2 family efflux MFS transporter permease subunit [Xanthomonadales bacterium]|nr:DHA2 family efflux MFS transporter permease subunit [Xanthomonadales bacterium]ODU94150.1 MAG: MFS transporter [Rhodanobacter sp. SCN 66-43]OJY84032.1 MAG: MFS transporter [Xanthomonadales bacterium 66-474]